MGKSAADGRSILLETISFHVKGQPKIVDSHVTIGFDKELVNADMGQVIAKYPKLRNLPPRRSSSSAGSSRRPPIILSEAGPEGCAACSSKLSPVNNYHNDTLYLAYTAAAYKFLFDLQKRHEMSLLSMLSWSFEF